MAFQMAGDVKAELERLSRLSKRDPNDILRELLEMPSKHARDLDKAPPAGSVTMAPQRFYMTPRGDRLPCGKIVMRLKKKDFRGEISGQGINLNGKIFDMPSPAAKSITHYEVNGWRAFKFEHGDGTRQSLDDFRSRS